MAREAIWALLGLLVLVGCGTNESSSEPAKGSGTGGEPAGQFDDPGVAIGVTRSQAELDRVLAGVAGLDAEGIAERYSVEHGSELGYDPLEANGLDLIQASALSLSESEQAGLQANGFAILANSEFPTFTYGLETIYAEDLPLFVSADSILDAVHRSFDDILKTLEVVVLIPELDRLLVSMLTELDARQDSMSTDQVGDTDLFLTVALSLLRGQTAAPATSLPIAEIDEIVTRANSASGALDTSLFGAKRIVDFSQFVPRGHYTESAELKQYSRAMMWLGRIDFRFLDTRSDGAQVFRRHQIEAALALELLFPGDPHIAHSSPGHGAPRR